MSCSQIHQAPVVGRLQQAPPNNFKLLLHQTTHTERTPTLDKLVVVVVVVDDDDDDLAS